MYNYRLYLKISSIILIVLGGLRCISFFASLGDYSVLMSMPGYGGTAMAFLLCDALTSLGAVFSGAVGLSKCKQDKGLIIWSILAFAVAAAFLVNAFMLIANSSGEYSSYSGRQGIVYMCAVPLFQALSYIGIEKNWAAKYQKYQKNSPDQDSSSEEKK
ncbi:MAG: hypothetical protein HFF60_04400 [Oscillospiraceae bacterium]|jgi:hypothetical protein|nr:hypothetical protein [Oscillospiraceae bacterium]MCI9587186.1 hypothetical protein [Oscillospiraceae bacterium]